MEETIGRLLKQQQDFLVDVLSTNRAWMIAQLEEQKTNHAKMQENPREPTITSTNISVPAFPLYVHTKQSFDSYIAQLTQHFEAYSVTKQEQKRAFFLSWVGADCFELLSKLFGTEDIQAQTYESIKEKLSTHYKENVHILASRYEFLSSKMKPEQKYSEWVAELRGIARNCRFVCSNNTCKTSFIDDLLRDILVLNSPHEPVRTAALQKPNPALADVIAIAESYETTQAMKKRMSSSTYRTCPIGSSNKSPAELLHGRQPKTRLNMLVPTPTQGSRAGSESSYAVSTNVYARNYARGPPWIPGVIQSKVGSMMYRVSTDQGLLRRHRNQLKARQ